MQLLRSFKFFLFILIFSQTNSRFRTQTLKSSSTSCFFFFYSYKTVNSVNLPNFQAFASFSNSVSFYYLYNIFSKNHNIGWPQVLEFLEFRELFWIFFDTGNVLEEGHFTRIVLEIILNLEFFISKIFSLPPF